MTEKILADWLIRLGRYTELKNVVIYLAEEEESCHCPKCAAVNPFVLQTRIALDAWREAKRVRPDLGLRNPPHARQLSIQRSGFGRSALRRWCNLLSRQPDL